MNDAYSSPHGPHPQLKALPSALRKRGRPLSLTVHQNFERAFRKGGRQASTVQQLARALVTLQAQLLLSRTNDGVRVFIVLVMECLR